MAATQWGWRGWKLGQNHSPLNYNYSCAGVLCWLSKKVFWGELPWNQDNRDGVITYLEPDILECEVKWSLGSITMNKASGSDGLPAELFQILKDDAMKVLHSICQQIWNTQQWPQDWKMSVFIAIPKKGSAKECSNDCTIALISHASKIISKFSNPGFNNMWTVNFQMFKLDLEKAEEPEIKLPTSVGSLKKSKIILEKHLLLLHWLH